MKATRSSTNVNPLGLFRFLDVIIRLKRGIG
jgi:hypothetical protein